MEVLLTGTLYFDGSDCVMLEEPGTPVPIWPRGFVARDRDGIELLDADGKVVARQGDGLDLTGGEIPMPVGGRACGKDRAFAVDKVAISD